MVISNAKLGDFEFHISSIHSPTPDFDPKSTGHERSIMVEKLGFSCNYRDAAIIEQLYNRCLASNQDGKLAYAGFGSDFVAKVLDVGSEVKDIKIGDRVIPNHSYPFREGNVQGGIVSNYASLRYEVLKEEQLIAIPLTISNAVAAALSITGQTAISMINKLMLTGNENILVTAGSSNTSIATILSLKNQYKNIKIFVATTNKRHHQKLLELKVDDVINIHEDSHSMELISNKIGGFDIVIDCFADIYLPKIMKYLNFNAKYITCGFYKQSERLHTVSTQQQSLKAILSGLIKKNISLIGNCLGRTGDLLSAIEIYEKGFNLIIVDSIFTEGESVNFIDRTFNDRDRFGKVVFLYSE